MDGFPGDLPGLICAVLQHLPHGQLPLDPPLLEDDSDAVPKFPIAIGGVPTEHLDRVLGLSADEQGLAQLQTGFQGELGAFSEEAIYELVAEAEAHVREGLAPFVDAGDTVDLVDHGAAAAPGLDHPLLQGLVDRSGADVRAKLGWTDVAFFAEHGVPAVNFGPGEPTLAHTADERVDRSSLESCHAVLRGLLVSGV